MSHSLQPGLHPDADQLNAFVEHALPPHEREQTLAHLAVCATCRSIVALTALPVEEPGTRPQPEAISKLWFSGWKLAWPVAAAFAALVPILIHLHKSAANRNDNRPQPEVALSRTPSPLPPVASRPSPVLQAVPPPSPPAKSPRRQEGVDLRRDNSQPPATRNAALGDSNLPAGTVEPTPAAGLSAYSFGRAQSAPELPGSIGALIDKKELPPPPPLQAAPQAAPKAAADAATSTVAVNNSAFTPIQAEPATTLRMRVSGNAPLPSGQPVLSRASSGSLVLALDTANTLFFSSDDGRHWKAIPAQWTGRAIKVNLSTPAISMSQYAAQGLGAGITTGNAMAAAAPAAPPPAAGMNGSLSGTLTDASGAVISGASVALKDASKQAVRSARTDASGQYFLDSLAPGTYQLQAQAPGFESSERPVTVAPAQQAVDNLQLKVGAAAETVTVESATAKVGRSKAAANEAAANKPVQAASPMPPAPVFEITNEAGERWTSPNGLNWSRSPAR
jgi:hypothetical protein